LPAPTKAIFHREKKIFPFAPLGLHLFAERSRRSSADSDSDAGGSEQEDRFADLIIGRSMA